MAKCWQNSLLYVFFIRYVYKTHENAQNENKFQKYMNQKSSKLMQ